jgi:hypothetical protein
MRRSSHIPLSAKPDGVGREIRPTGKNLVHRHNRLPKSLWRSYHLANKCLDKKKLHIIIVESSNITFTRRF